MKKFINNNMLYIIYSESEVKQLISEKTGVPVDKITASGCQLEIDLSDDESAAYVSKVAEL